MIANHSEERPVSGLIIFAGESAYLLQKVATAMGLAI
jgi:hypothetical protein